MKTYINMLMQNAIESAFGLSFEDYPFVIEHPSENSNGDYSCNAAFVLAKPLKQSPYAIADSLLDYLSKEGLIDSKVFSKIEVAAPGFLNFYLSPHWLLNEIKQISQQKTFYGTTDKNKGKNIIVEYSQPNANKAMHIGHALNNFIGFSLSRILESQGYKVYKANYAGDIGVDICKAMLMYKKYGNGQLPNKKPDHFVGDFYVMFGNKCLENESVKEKLTKEAEQMLRDWEAGDSETVALWKKITSWVYEGWGKTYADQKVKFDFWDYESANYSLGKDVVLKAVSEGKAYKDDSGAVFVDLEEYGLGKKALLRSDGTALYLTYDLQLAKNSVEKYDLYKRYYVVDYRQSDHFKKVFKILQLFGYDWADRLKHVSYGMVVLPEGKMSSRKGLIVTADEAFEKLIEAEQIELKNNNRTLPKDVVKNISLSAFKYSLLKVDTSMNITFDYSKVTRFDGDTGPYIQYTHARANSILNAENFIFDSDLFLYNANEAKLNEKELDLLRTLYRLPEVLKSAAENSAPNMICNFVYDVCKKFNSFYGSNQIISDDPIEKNIRLGLTNATKIIISNCLYYLGLEPVEKM
jgi:arginyl-tRNA synthetase